VKFVPNAREAGQPGTERERIRLRRLVATQFFDTHIHQVTGDWMEARRALQTVDFFQPVIVGPISPMPPKLVELPGGSFLSGGFFAEQIPAGTKIKPVYWQIDVKAPLLKWYAPYVRDAKLGGGSGPGDARYFVPAARTGQAMYARRLP
jgi:hypothetical protein